MTVLQEARERFLLADRRVVECAGTEMGDLWNKLRVTCYEAWLAAVRDFRRGKQA